jgi:glutathione S-transferase
MAKVRLHRCRFLWVKASRHPCWRVQSALDDQGVDYEIVKASVRKSRRADVERLSGQRQLPVIEFEDGTIYRAESQDMADRIRAGKLFEGQAASSDDGETAPS